MGYYNRMEIYYISLEGYGGWGIIIVWVNRRGLWRVRYYNRIEIYRIALEG